MMSHVVTPLPALFMGIEASPRLKERCLVRQVRAGRAVECGLTMGDVCWGLWDTY